MQLVRLEVILKLLLNQHSHLNSLEHMKQYKNQRHYIPKLPAHLIHEDYAFWLTLFQKREIQVAYTEEATAHLLQAAGSRSANKWLGAKSHAYILATYGSVSRFKRIALMVSYAYNASKKRILGRLFTFS